MDIIYETNVGKLKDGEKNTDCLGTSRPKDDPLVNFLGFLIYPTPRAKEAGNLEIPMIVDKKQKQKPQTTTTTKQQKLICFSQSSSKGPA